MSSNSNDEVVKSMLKIGMMTCTHPILVKGKIKDNQFLIYDIPIIFWLRCWKIMNKISKCTVSVGSGSGSVETFLQKRSKSGVVICVDPNPQSFIETLPIFKKPDFSYVDDLIKINKTAIGNLNLMLCWPTPNLGYDIEAVTKLLPRSILAMVAVDGAAGSSAFLEWIKSHENYTLIFRCDSFSLSTGDLFIYPDKVKPTLFLFVRNDLIKPSFKIETVEYYTQSDLELVYQSFDFDGELAKLPRDKQSEVIARRNISMLLLLGGYGRYCN